MLVIKFGTYAAVVLIAIGLSMFFGMGGASAGPESYGMGEVVGYLSIVISMVFVYLGIRQHRDENLDGQIRFAEALKMGCLIVLFPAAAFSAYNVVYVKYLDPAFADKYYEYALDKMKAEAEPSEYREIEATMESQRDMFANIPFQTVLMFLTVYVIGFIVSILSALLLARKKDSDIVETSQTQKSKEYSATI